MRRIAVFIVGLSMVGCSKTGTEFGQELKDAEAVAWQTCVEEGLGEAPEDAPELIEVDEQSIRFVWNEQTVDEHGGPNYCETSNDGHTLLEVRISATPLS
ncbi:MAG: hypothetical protein ABJN35_09980 [Erythrobacter sp.]